jgi:hypothetical protein
MILDLYHGSQLLVFVLIIISSYAITSEHSETCMDPIPTHGFLNASQLLRPFLPPLLYSFPGSGNTWVRLLIEHATGIYSGSIYNDMSLMKLLPGESRCDRSVSVVKAHPILAHAFDGIKVRIDEDDKTLHGMHKCQSGRSHILKFDRAIFLYRNPFAAIYSEGLRSFTKSHNSSLSISLFKANIKYFRRKYDAMARHYAKMWVDYNNIIDEIGIQNVHFVRYEHLLNLTTRNSVLDKLVDFIGLPGGEQPTPLGCVFKYAQKPSVHRSSIPLSDTKMQSLSRRGAYEILSGEICEYWAKFGEISGRIGYPLYDPGFGQGVVISCPFVKLDTGAYSLDLLDIARKLLDEV